MSKTKKKKKKKKRSKVLRCDNINKKGPGLPKLTMKPSLILNFMQNFKNFAKVKFRDGTPGQTFKPGLSRPNRDVW